MVDRIPILAAAATGSASVEGSWGGLLLYITVALGISFLCSMLEAILLSSSLSYVQVMAENGRRAGRMMRRFKENLEQPISAILTLNTIAHTVGAAGAGAQAAALFGSQWLGLISAVLTLMILVFSEIIPKTIGATYWRQFIPFAAYAIQVLVILLFPAVKGFEMLNRLLTARAGEKEPTVTRSELEVLAQISTGEGALEEKEHLILRNLLHLGNVQVYDVMTPRTVVFALPEDMTIGEVLRVHPLLTYSRIPIYKEGIDEISGFVLRHQILAAAAEDRDSLKLSQLTLLIHTIPETLTVARALQEFIARQEHIFLILDEYGGTSGIITLEDAVESLLGVEITDESDVVADLRTLAKQRYSRQIQALEAAEVVEKKRSTPAEAAPARSLPSASASFSLSMDGRSKTQ
ncbi:MAG: DUF21 domain-containing protein [Anaerolineae bacterium]|nr:DUF21 domain-containing protein [Anaerolineae bacterium]